MASSPPDGRARFDGDLGAANAVDYLRARGVLRPKEVARAEALAGGVSNTVIAVHIEGGRSLVVKQALPKLQVADEWLATKRRILTEARALDLFHRITPRWVPPLVDVDPDDFLLTILHAPSAWTSWKGSLMRGAVDVDVAGRLGALLAEWQTATNARADVAADFADYEAFAQLRVDPFYRSVAQRRPEVAAAVTAQIDAVTQTRSCLVHGDFSPKNVLAGRGGLWVLDFEVAHYGDPAFDVAFLLTHLLLKALHVPGSQDALAVAAGAFWRAYQRAAPSLSDERVVAHVGCLLAARVDGKSPAEYLTEAERERARASSKRLLLDPPPRVELLAGSVVSA